LKRAACGVGVVDATGVRSSFERTIRWPFNLLSNISNLLRASRSNFPGRLGRAVGKSAFCSGFDGGLLMEILLFDALNFNSDLLGSIHSNFSKRLGQESGKGTFLSAKLFLDMMSSSGFDGGLFMEILLFDAVKFELEIAGGGLASSL
jgi:hypothetical protein